MFAAFLCLRLYFEKLKSTVNFFRGGRGREREKCSGEAERGGENLKQALHLVQSPMWGSISQPEIMTEPKPRVRHFTDWATLMPPSTNSLYL